ncbi:MAG TPA: uroporphyrinogen decarboxylase family protein [Longilinea sp.]|nr:uroporphyrinogen decarboxylase family protein [Longilinea sp.]
MTAKFVDYVLEQPHRLAMPIGIYAGLEITGASVRRAIIEIDAQAQAALALHEALGTAVLLTGMDLSPEAEIFGSRIRVSDTEVPTVVGRLVTSLEEIKALPVPRVGAGRTRVYLEAVRRLAVVGSREGIPLLGGMIGPFSLAARLFGVSEALEVSATDPGCLAALLEKVTPFLADYALAFRQAGAAGVIMAEPAAGLLSPRGLGQFSALYVKRIVDAAQTDDFSIVLHNCGAKLVHLEKTLESGAAIYHFGAPMDLPAALKAVDGKVILSGNLDPTAVFYSGTPETVRTQARALLDAAQPYPRFFMSSGCDLPPGTPVANIRAFLDTVASYSR